MWRRTVKNPDSGVAFFEFASLLFIVSCFFQIGVQAIEGERIENFEDIGH